MFRYTFVAIAIVIAYVSPAYGARAFNGTTDQITYPHVSAFDGENQFCISLWYYPASGATGFPAPFNQWAADGSNGFATATQSDDETRMRWGIANAGAAAGVAPASTFTPDAWQHVFLCFDGTQSTNATKARMWRNGSEVTLTYEGTVPVSAAERRALVRAEESAERAWRISTRWPRADEA